MAAKDAKNVGSKTGVTPKPVAPKSVVDEYSPSPLSIDGIRSGAMQSRIAKGFVLVSGGVMALGFIMSSLNSSNNIGGVSGGGGRGPVGTAATVGNQSISGQKLNDAFERQMQFMGQYGQRTGVTDYLQSKQSTLRQLTDQAAEVVAAQNSGLAVSNEEVDKKIQTQFDEVLKGQGGQNPAAVRRQIEARFGSVDKWKQTTMESMDREELRNSLLVEKLEKKIKDDNKVTEDDYKRSVTKLKLWQIVIRPKFPSATSKDFKADQEKMVKEAQAKAQGVVTGLKAKGALADFQAAVLKSSDDSATKPKKGDLGWILPSAVTAGPEVGEALSKAGGNLLGPVADAVGNQYIFFIEGHQTDLPKDYATKKKKLIEDFETQKDNEALTKKQDEWKKASTPQVSDPALAAYRIQMEQLNMASPEDQKKLRADAIARYQQGLAGNHGMEAAAINYQMAQIYQGAGEKDQQLAALANAVKEKSDDAQIHVEYARALGQSKKTKEAQTQLAAASKALDESPAGPSMFGGNPNDAVHQQIAAEYDTLKLPAMAAAERAKIKPSAPNGMGGMGSSLGGGNIQIR